MGPSDTIRWFIYSATICPFIMGSVAVNWFFMGLADAVAVKAGETTKAKTKMILQNFDIDGTPNLEG